MFRSIATLAASIGFSMLGVTSAKAQDAAGATVFKRCAICHSTVGKISIGPPLNGVVGRKAGAIPKFVYSKAIASSMLTWDKTTLDKFLARPQGETPGTKMGFAGLANPKDRQDVIAYLATLNK